MPLLAKAAGTLLVTTATPTLGWLYYSRGSTFVPFTTTSSSFPSAAFSKLNPDQNKPAVIDHCVRKVPLSQLQTTDQEALTRRFCQGVWSGPGFEIQRRYLERKYRALDGRESHLWDKKDLATSDYAVGTRIADHFEVVERSPEKVTVRCGDSPTIQDKRPSDGIFSIEVSKDEKDATFHLKSVFFNSTPSGKDGAQLPWWFDSAHKEYTKLWMETSVRKLLK
ncbi:uncharacterized protein PV09_04514 [Verruconis gallopava]|uniref:Uncharacterized protein n=1 Tax=Verruconis gallopava TaxID=253628 RepID=A0A0D1XNQ5_9PEZI|nr:uncharacterized protein PV09_04514 [Verruconis gallopava]KIW04206.1 hypothetical protein PV09_04514 [Verruconis gallopava]